MKVIGILKMNSIEKQVNSLLIEWIALCKPKYEVRKEQKQIFCLSTPVDLERKLKSTGKDLRESIKSFGWTALNKFEIIDLKVKEEVEESAANIKEVATSDIETEVNELFPWEMDELFGVIIVHWNDATPPEHKGHILLTSSIYVDNLDKDYYRNIAYARRIQKEDALLAKYEIRTLPEWTKSSLAESEALF